jgi:hypothetical protein
MAVAIARLLATPDSRAQSERLQTPDDPDARSAEEPTNDQTY